MLNRRDVLNIGVTAVTATVLVGDHLSGADQRPFRIVDTNVSLFHWPFRRLPLDETETLVTKLRALGIGEAWAGSFEGVLHRDIAGVNQRLADACRDYRELVPIGSINPTLPDWKHDLRQCLEHHGMPGIRLHPNYHGYTLNDDCFRDLLEAVAPSACLIQIAAAMEDTRTQHPMLRVSDVDLSPLAEAVRKTAGVRVQTLNCRLRTPVLERLADTPGVYFDTARVDSTDGVPKLVASVPPGRVLFGTHAPFLIPEAALIRVHESDSLKEAGVRDVLSNNADRLPLRTNA